MSTLQPLLDLQEPLKAATRAWATEHTLDLPAVDDLHQQASVAAHRHYCATIDAYRTLAEDLDLVDCDDVDTIRSELASTDDLFKSYDEAWLDAGDFAAMTRWLGGIYNGPVDIDTRGVQDIAGWLARLEEAGTKVWFSSGTSGHLSFVPRDETAAANLDEQIRSLMGPLLGGAEHARQLHAILLSFNGGRQGIASAAEKVAAITRAQTFLYDFPLTPDGVRAAAKGDRTANAEFRRLTVDELPERQRAVLSALDACAADGSPTLILGAPFQVLDLCRQLEDEDRSLNLPTGSKMFLSGGWKSFAGQRIPREELEQLVRDRLDLEHVAEGYGMTECTTQFPMCEHGRFHIPPTLWPMVVDEALVPMDGLGRGRFAVCDPFATCYPGPFITGDEVDLGRDECDCGLPGFSLAGAIKRIAGGEVKGCGGVMASVRG